MNYPVLDVVVTRTTIFAAADGPGGHLRALDLDGTSRWNVTADGAVQALTLLGGVLYAGGHFDHVCVSAATGPQGQCLAGQRAAMEVRRRRRSRRHPDGLGSPGELRPRDRRPGS